MKTKSFFAVALCGGLLLGSVGALAGDPPAHSGPNFQQHKQQMLQEMEQRISSLRSLKTCVSAAANPEAIKTCFQKQRKREELERKKRIDAQIKHLQEEKSKIGQ